MTKRWSGASDVGEVTFGLGAELDGELLGLPGLGHGSPEELGLAVGRQPADRLIAVEVGRERSSPRRRRAIALLQQRPRSRLPARAVTSAGNSAFDTASRSTVSIGRPNADDTCSRFAIRLTSAVRLWPARVRTSPG